MGLAALPIAAVAVTAIAAGASATAAYAQGQSQKKAAAYNAQMEQYNATIQAQQGQQDAANIETQGELIQGKAKAAAAASGLSGGSADDIQYADLIRNDQDALAAKYRGTIGEYNADAQSSLDSSASSNAGLQGDLAAGGALLSGASKSVSMGSSSFGGGQTVGSVFGSTTSQNSPGF